jgi:hypothetical protein
MPGAEDLLRAYADIHKPSHREALCDIAQALACYKPIDSTNRRPTPSENAPSANRLLSNGALSLRTSWAKSDDDRPCGFLFARHVLVQDELCDCVSPKMLRLFAIGAQSPLFATLVRSRKWLR